MKLTRQGVRDLNPRPVNGHRRVHCVHLPGPLEEVERHYMSSPVSGATVALIADYGRRCLKCGEVCA